MQLEMARRGAHEGAAIDERYQQWISELVVLQKAKECCNWLQINIQINDLFIEKMALSTQLAETAAQRLIESSTIESLTSEDLWVRLLQTTNNSAQLLLASIKQKWADEVSQFSKLTPPLQLKATTSLLPQNEVPLSDYEANYKIADRFSKMEIPSTSQDLSNFLLALNNCVEAAKKLCFDAPETVIEFFRAVNSGGANLSLVTPEVLAWLSENRQIQNYLVRGFVR
jgi:hypothetical protein